MADRGINNGENLLAIKQAGFDYIVGAKIKNMGDSMKNQILDFSTYRVINEDKELQEPAKDKAITFAFNTISHC